jgi:hypothetical protein
LGEADSEVLAFAQRLMREVWEASDPAAIPRFYREDVIGHHRGQEIPYADVVNRVTRDPQRFAGCSLTRRRRATD